ncbi:MAG: hypothetical protein KKB81_00530 [Candidatus Margulisbacteria bacterium]|nr:hypothetical protein [Candidatus Margulisiibacteriota bacterium]MBU1022309.1 hypothetical protein [Candidatus Margulisiibacteriota bacterium]MBU1729922.1 hypothetical protein [Candidatus Margulisiibacteriota bacterium]MBU1955955.1 hypothetical protein [Candidatus Margulisiibacteriota bacterium]
MLKIIIYSILIFTLCLAPAAGAFAEDEDLIDFTEDLEMTGDPQVFNVYILDKKLDDIDFVVKFAERDLWNGMVYISGEAKTDIGIIDVVEVTLDEGQSYQNAKGTDQWEFSFTPKNNHEYVFSARAKDSTGSSSYFDDLNMITIKYAKYSTPQEVALWLKDFRAAYNMEDLGKCMGLISDDFADGKSAFEKELDNEFKASENIQINIYPSNIDVNNEDDEVVVSFAFRKEKSGAVFNGKSQILLRKEQSGSTNVWKLIQIRGDRFAGQD